MSTRCQIGFYAKDNDAIEDFEALIYRHSDGYPGNLKAVKDGGEYGVLIELVPFLRDFQTNRGLSDTEYAAARTLQHLANLYDLGFSKLEASKTYNYIGYGVSSAIHSDIEYLYAVKPTKLEVYAVSGWDEHTYKLTETVDLPANTANAIV